METIPGEGMREEFFTKVTFEMGLDELVGFLTGGDFGKEKSMRSNHLKLETCAFVLGRASDALGCRLGIHRRAMGRCPEQG